MHNIFLRKCQIYMKNIRCFSDGVNKKSYFVTTPIYYVNAAPHIGHLYSSVIADAIQRWHQISNPNEEVIFSTGTDEHGSKIQQAANRSKTAIYDYCTNIAQTYKSLSKDCNVAYTHFIRTTDARHKEATRKFWKTLDKNGHIYSSRYCGWYCIADETFLAGSQLKDEILPSGDKRTISAESGHPVEWTEEQNYMFRLSNFEDDLKYWLTRNENCVKPKKFHRLLLELMDSDLIADVSISRPLSRVHWGIHVPGDEEQSIYVWLDALVNYLTAAGYPDTQSEIFKNVWPPDVQVIGKDILKFHGIYWPAFLMAAGLEPPRTLFCHSHWTVEGQKMSKSKNNVICPFDKMQIYTSDGLRYFLLREGVAHSDGNYSDVKIMRILNSELADTLGNLLSRCCGTALNQNQAIPSMKTDSFKRISKEDSADNLLKSLQKLSNIAEANYAEFNFYKAVDAVIATLHNANAFFETMKPWELKKSSKEDDLNVVLHITMETLRVCGIILQPVMPTLSETLLNKLNISKSMRNWKDLHPFSWEKEIQDTHKLSDNKSILYKRILADDLIRSVAK